MEYKKGMLLGRLSNGFQSDHGVRVHAVTCRKTKRPPCPYNDYGKKEIPDDDYKTDMGLCGAKPGRRSVGWAWEKDMEVNCPKCLKRLEKENKKTS
jgi:hypothetical protein